MVKDKTQDNITKKREELKKKGIVVINETFSDSLMEDVFFSILDMTNDNNIDKISIYINSCGGQIDALMPIVDLIDSIEKPVVTVGMGKVYSAAAILLLCGKIRCAFEHTDFLLHEVSTTRGFNKNKQIQEDSKYLEKINSMLSKLIQDRTKMKKQDVDKYMNSNLDIFMTSKDALNYGIIDTILNGKEEKKENKTPVQKVGTKRKRTTRKA